MNGAVPGKRPGPQAGVCVATQADAPLPALRMLWAALGQRPMAADVATPAEFLSAAVDRFELARVPASPPSAAVHNMGAMDPD